ncbi:MAG: hypothetical protein CVU05_03705 [Bacteroidetes bacterium HGW-Bacteroidetes-21]|jgi:hypothetical protein|nr:MAG: hypothetical protein CVU05_03705 [Bacteroidetes bacterium HGW-Bacteroidetes-21]
MKRIVFLISFIAFLGVLNAQTVLMDENPGQDTIVPKWGKNRQNFIHLYFGYSMFADNFSDIYTDQFFIQAPNLKWLSSHDFTIGLRYKLKITSFYAMGLDLGWNNKTFSIEQESDKSFPTPIVHNKEKIYYNTMSLEYFNRINFDRRGNKIGKFLDIGAYGFVCIGSVHYTMDILENMNSGYSTKTEVKNYSPDYLVKNGYGLSARLGINNFVLTARYRMSDLIKEKYNFFPEFPRLEAGIQFSIH